MALALVVCPGVALAHSPIQGLDDFYNGLLHPLYVPAHVLLVFAFGFLLGQQGIPVHLRVIWMYVIGVVAGVLLAGTGHTLFDPLMREVAVLAAAAGVALLVVVGLRVPMLPMVLFGLGAGVLMGLDSLQGDLAGEARLVALFGSAVALYFLPLYPAGLAEWAQRRAWCGVVVRVMASWVAASALLVLALMLAPAT